MSDRVVKGTWIAGACVVLLFIIRTWLILPFPRPFHPVIPYQYTPMSDARYWLFLQQAAPCIAKGTSFTLVGATPEQEHELYVLSVGAIPHARPLPSAYFGFPHPEHVAGARFVLAFGSMAAPAGTREVCRNDFGAVFERGAR